MRLQLLTKKALFSVFFIACISCFNAQALPSSCPSKNILGSKKLQSGFVDWLPDGDTIHTKNGTKLRILNIDTPEINPNNDKSAEPFSREAKQKLKDLIGKSGKIYWLTDNRKKDRYGRVLAHVFNHEGELLSAKLIASGHAKMLVIPPNDGFWRCLKKIENMANKSSKGIWALTNYQKVPLEKVRKNNGFQWIEGKITQRQQTKSNLWLVIEDRVWIGIPNKRKRFFNKTILDKKVGSNLSLRGFIYESHGRLRIKLKHPAMLY